MTLSTHYLAGTSKQCSCHVRRAASPQAPHTTCSVYIYKSLECVLVSVRWPFDLSLHLNLHQIYRCCHQRCCHRCENNNKTTVSGVFQKQTLLFLLFNLYYMILWFVRKKRNEQFKDTTAHQVAIHCRYQNFLRKYLPVIWHKKITQNGMALEYISETTPIISQYEWTFYRYKIQELDISLCNPDQSNTLSY